MYFIIVIIMEILGLKRGPNGDVGIWSEMVWACVKEE